MYIAYVCKIGFVSLPSILSFMFDIVLQILEGKHLQTNMSFDFVHLESIDFKPMFLVSRCSNVIKE